MYSYNLQVTITKITQLNEPITCIVIDIMPHIGCLHS